jgi:hypothetical protein
VVDIKADVFRVTNGGGGTITPFYITGGQTYIDGANINNYIRSNSYTAGSSGFNINALDGSAEFNNLTARGTILGDSATAYTVGTGLFSGLSGGNYRFRVGNPTGARIQWNGTAVEVYNASNQLTMTSGGIDYSFVSGTKPPANADRTADNIALGITGQGTLATKNSVSATTEVTGLGGLATKSEVRIGNEVKFANGVTMNTTDFVNKLAKIGSSADTEIGNFFVNASITNAYIGNAAVSTLKIQGDAVTVPRYGEASVNNYNLTTSWSPAYAATTFSIAGLDPGELARIVAVASVQVYPSDSTVTNFVVGVFSNGVLVNEVFSTLRSDGFSVVNVASGTGVNGTYTIDVRVRCQADPNGSNSKNNNQFVIRNFVLGAKR